MFHDSLIHRANGAHRKVTAYVSCVLFTMLLAAGSVRAEDDLAELDPNGNLTIVDFFRNLWEGVLRLWDLVGGYIS